MDEYGRHAIVMKFYQTAPTNSMVLGQKLPTLLANHADPIAQKQVSLDIRPVTWESGLRVGYAGSKVKNIVVEWDNSAASDSVDGFKINYCEADNETPTGCKNDTELPFAEVNATASSYKISLIQAVQSGLLDWEKDYLFRIYAFDQIHAFTIGNTVVPAMTTYYYGGRSNILLMPPSPMEGIDLNSQQNDIYIIVEPGSYNNQNTQATLVQTVNDLFDSKPEGTGLKVGVILEDFGGQNEPVTIALTDNKNAIVNAIESLNFPSSGTASLPDSLMNLDDLSWSSGTQRSIIALVGDDYPAGGGEIIAGNGEVNAVPDTTPIKEQLLQQNIVLLGVGVNGKITNTHPISSLIEYELPVSVISNTQNTTIPELHEVMLPPVFY
jgi:hypothetical protein